MEYECVVLPLDKLMLSGNGSVESLCNSCKTPDCTNPIREKEICVFGKTKSHRVWVSGRTVRQVVACKGYTSTEIEKEYESDDAIPPIYAPNSETTGKTEKSN